jgi:hypothetical protein
VNKGTSYLLLQNLKGWSPAQFEHLCLPIYTPWGDIDMELWLLHVSTTAKYAHFDNTNVSQKLESKNEPFLPDFKRGKTPQSQKGNTQRGFRSCWNFNKGKCSYGQKCRYAHKCSNCAGDHPFEYHKGRCPYMYVGNCCDFWLCDCQLTTLYGKVAAKLRVSCEISDRL